MKRYEPVSMPDSPAVSTGGKPIAAVAWSPCPRKRPRPRDDGRCNRGLASRRPSFFRFHFPSTSTPGRSNLPSARISGGPSFPACRHRVPKRGHRDAGFVANIGKIQDERLRLKGRDAFKGKEQAAARRVAGIGGKRELLIKDSIS